MLTLDWQDEKGNHSFELKGGWDRDDVAAAQLSLVLTELIHPEECQPYKNFLWAMALIEGETLLDIGCGVGHYGVLVERYHRDITYYGTDASIAMIEQARLLAPLGHFAAIDFHHNDLSSYDIVLASQVIEPMGGDVWANMRWLLSTARRYIILNRIRLTNETSHAIIETTYCGNVGVNWLWNQAELELFIAAYCDIVGSSIWENGNQATYVLEVNRDKCTVRSGCACKCK